MKWLDDKIQGLVQSKSFNNLLHAGLFLASTYIAANPKYAWLVPAIQGLGQVVNPPK